MFHFPLVLGSSVRAALQFSSQLNAGYLVESGGNAVRVENRELGVSP